MHAWASKGAQKSGSSHVISFLLHAGEGGTARLGEDSRCHKGRAYRSERCRIAAGKPWAHVATSHQKDVYYLVFLVVRDTRNYSFDRQYMHPFPIRSSVEHVSAQGRLIL
jgi:hypothetical protein